MDWARMPRERSPLVWIGPGSTRSSIPFRVTVPPLPPVLPEPPTAES